MYQDYNSGEWSGGADYSGYTEVYYPSEGNMLAEKRPYSSSSSCSSHEEHQYIPPPYTSVIVDSAGIINHQFVH